MVTELEKYREIAEENGMCSEYIKMWDECGSNKQMMDMFMGVKAIDFVFDSIAKGWGISPDTIREKFAPFLNGRYKSEQNGYQSMMFCKYKGAVLADTTIIGIIGSDMDIEVPSTSVCEIYVTGKSNIRVTGKGQAVFVCYGNPEDINISYDNGLRFKRIDKKERDKNE